MDNISFIIPSYNNLQHLKNVYVSICKNAPNAKIMFLDDGSTDGTWEWLCSLPKNNLHTPYRSETRVGHTILYDKGISLVDSDVVGILHADMIIGPNYVENLIKHLKPGTVVCATRIEPPLHPEGKEKIIKDFGMDFDTLNIDAFEEYALKTQNEFKNQTTKGMFAPWIIYKKDFQAIGGHDPLFAPFPYEDSDIFQRWILAGYKLIQSRDAFVYHLTCRGHRWNDQVGKDDEYYKIVSNRAARNYLRKWGSWIKNDEYQYPTILSKYDIGFIVENCTLSYLETLEPWCSTIYVKSNIDSTIQDYIKKEQPNTKFNLYERIKPYDNEKQNEILVSFDASKLTNQNFQLLTQLPEIIKDNGEIGSFELDIFTIDIININEYQDNLVYLK
jgi:glycosyltransferase involved in cell wall biosynthesis